MSKIVTLRELSYNRFIDMLFSGELEPGTFVSQRELADKLDVSLGPIREALKRLESEGMVKIHAQRGIQIQQVDYNLIRETFGFRLVLEKAGLEKYIEMTPDQDIQELINGTEDVAHRLSKNVTEDVVEEARRMDRLMHDRFIAALDNSVITECYSRNWRTIMLARLNGKHLPERSAIIMQEHLRVLEAALKRDQAGARQALDAHLKVSHLRALGLNTAGNTP